MQSQASKDGLDGRAPFFGRQVSAERSGGEEEVAEEGAERFATLGW